MIRAAHHVDADHRTSEPPTSDAIQQQKEDFKTISHRYISTQIILPTICRREREREFNLTDQLVAEGVHPLTGSAAKKSEDLSTNLITYHTLAYLTYQFKLNGDHSTHIPEQISGMKVGKSHQERERFK